MGMDVVFESEIDYEGFTITVDVNNPKYLTGEVKQTDIELGSGYLVFVNQSDGVTVAKHGHVNVLRVVEGMVRAAGEVNALHVMIANTIKRILLDDRADLAKFFIQGADALRDWPKLQEGV